LTAADEGQLYHANALKIGSYGILIMGASGAGKSLVSLTLLERAQLFGRAGVLVSDDYVLLRLEEGKLVAHAPTAIRGAIEIRGAGLFTMPHQGSTQLQLVVELRGKGERFPQGRYFDCLGVSLPLLKLPEAGKADILAICHAIEAHLFKQRWVS